MSHQLSVNEEASKTLQNYMESPGAKVKGSISENHLMVEASFEAQNQAEYESVTIKAADIIVREITLIDSTPLLKMSEEQEEEYYNNLLISSATGQDLQVSNNLSPYIENSIEGIYSDISYITEVKSNIKDFARMIKFSGSSASSSNHLNIKDGKIISEKQSYYHNEEAQINLNEVFFRIENQASLNNQISSEMARNIHNKIYEDFPILNSSSPIIPTIFLRTTNIKDILLSRTYSNHPELAYKAISSLSRAYQNQDQLFKDMLAVICLGIAKGSDEPTAPATLHFTAQELLLQNFLLENLDSSTLVVKRKDPLKIIHTISQEDLSTARIKDSAAGAYKTEFNTAIFLQDAYRLVHELGHAAANILFLNDGNPYFKEKEEAFNNALISVLSKIYEYVENPQEKFQINDLCSLHSKLFYSPTLALITAASAPEVQNFKDFFNSIDVFSEYTITEAHNKYFAEKSLEEVTQEDLFAAAAQEIENLHLTSTEANLIQRIGILVFHYGFKDMSREIFAIMLELYYEHDNDKAIKDFFAPIEEIVSNDIHQLVETQLIIPHQLECNGTVNTNNFSYCVEEFLN